MTAEFWFAEQKIVDQERSEIEGQQVPRQTDEPKGPGRLGPWEELAAGAHAELQKWAETRRDRRRERPRLPRRPRGSES